jgi:hypothetical protein
MATEWCDRMRAAAEGHTVNKCDGYATVRLEYAEVGRLGSYVTRVCDACGQAMRDDHRVAVFAVTRFADGTVTG